MRPHSKPFPFKSLPAWALLRFDSSAINHSIAAFIALISIAVLPTQAVNSDPLTPFLDAYCLKCHGQEKQKGDRRFDQMAQPVHDIENAETLQEILDLLNLGDMPPEDEDIQPTPRETKEVVAWLTQRMAEAREAARSDAGKVVLRRLNRNEYLNTVRDLFEFEMNDFDPTKTFPKDQSVNSFDNNGEGLVTSDYLMRNYLEAARAIADKAVRPGPRPERLFLKKEGQEIGGHMRGLRSEVARMTIRFRQPLGIAELDKKRGVPADGEYRIRFKALAHQRKSRYKDEDLRYNSDEPMRLSISIDSRELGATAHRIVGEYEIPDGEVIEIEHRLWLDKGFTFHLHWANGPDGSFKRIMRKVLPKYNDEALYPLRNPPEMYIGSGPELHVYSLEIEGPFYDEWPLPGFTRYFPDPPKKPGPEYLEDSLHRIAQRAFRRPVSREELNPYFTLVRHHLSDTNDFWKATKYGIRALLVSPQFLYFAEPSSDDESRHCSPYELATRLSYYLWSSMPDDQLMAKAADGSLLNRGELRKQVDRMLDDPKSDAFVHNFVDQWLHLRQLGEMPPDPEANPAYYEENLEAAMKAETRLFFKDLLQSNGNLLNFIDSDYTFLNQSLAKHYGIPNVAGEAMRKVALEPKNQRGGLLGQGSILTATSNGVETQPVLRGVWVLENLLGSPPNPPPPDVDPIEPDTRGVSSMRDLMEKHRENPTCYECHRKMDPLGLAMENFDHVGAWRDRYTMSLAIDARAEMPDGFPIDGAQGIRDYLMEQPERFTRCLTEKLLTYALGRSLAFTDRDDIDQIVEVMPELDYGLRELVQQTVASEIFLTK